MTVAIVKTSEADIVRDMRRLLNLLHYRPSRQRIFVKPNLVRPFYPNRGVCTHPAVVEALLQLFPEHDFVIGDGVPAPADYEKCLKFSGFKSLARRYGNVTLVNLDAVPREKVQWEYGELLLPTLLRTHEYINVAKLKTHSQTTVSLCAKNQKGLLALSKKKWFHQHSLHRPILALGEAVRPDLNIIDGLVALEGNGPSFFGTPLRANILVAGDDIWRTDQVGCRVMGFDPRKVRHLKQVAAVDTVGMRVDDVRRRFKPPRREWNIGRVRIRFDDKCCSICLSNLPRFRREIIRHPWKLLKALRYAAFGGLTLVGGSPPPEKRKGGKVICLGRCGLRYAEESGALVAGGCPFRLEELIEHL
ncbi:MAG: hypothetical protein DRP79_02125 [Planctomycetota bacterium]|nr:MAG: hypothetical protein DRP79_02125 [Planctomycetota bacterium]